MRPAEIALSEPAEDWMRGFERLIGWRHTKVALAVAGMLGGVVSGIALALTVGAAQPTQRSRTPAVNYVLAKQPAPGFALVDQNGTTISLGAQKGHVVLLTFMDPLCTTLCPLMAKDIAAMEQKRPKGLDPELLVVSVAHGRTSAEIAKFISSERVDWLPGWHWLVGPSAAALNMAWRKWGITAQSTPSGVQHDSLLSVIDSNGYLRVTFPAPLPIDDVVSAIRSIGHS